VRSAGAAQPGTHTVGPGGSAAQPGMDAARPGTGAAQRSVLLLEEGGQGGVAAYTAELAAALARAGWLVHVASSRDNELPAAPGVRVHALFPYLRGPGTLRRALRALGLARPLNGLGHLAMTVPAVRVARRCDLVHVQGGEWPPLRAAQMLVLRCAGRPLVYTPHNTFDRGGRSYPRAHALIRRCAARIVIHAEHDRTGLSSAQARKAVVIPHGEYGGLAARAEAGGDPDAIRAELGVGPEELLVLLFGQLRSDKGVRDLLQAAAEVGAVHVVLAGEEHGALAESAAALADPRLRGRALVLEGFVAPAQASRLFAAADVVALPYSKASASGVLLLAYGYGRPVLAYPVGGLPEYVIDGETGWLCERPDAAALAERLREIAGAGRAESRRRGAAARRISLERFGWDAIARRTIALYEEALRRS
jgi:glycosyltransferase involved in cell wall biosynthesis